MSERDWQLMRLGEMLSLLARPHPCDESLTVDVRANLWKLGVPCNELTPREELVARLWAKKRSLTAMQPGWGGPGITPPTAA
jgi:hypothetical protein